MAMFFDDMLLTEIRERSDIVELISAHTDLKRSGNRYLGLCPFHREKTPSFFVSAEDQLFYCFGCNEGGNIFSFVEKAHHLDFIEAVRFLAERAGVVLPEEQGQDSKEHLLKKRIYEINKSAARYFHRCLQEDKVAYDYLISRGMNSKVITAFGLGYAKKGWDDLLKHLSSEGYSEAQMIQAGLVLRKEKGAFDFFRDRIIFPVIDLRGNVIAFGGRVLDQSLPKYLNTGETPVFKKRMNLFALNHAKNAQKDYLILAEGYMDVISLYQYGFTNAVASLGTAFCEDHARLIKRYAKRVLIAFDGDEAGKKAVHKAADILLKEEIQVKVITLKGGKDPDEILKKAGAEYFSGLIKQAKPYIEFMLDLEKEHIDFDSLEGKINYAKKATAHLIRVSDPLERELYIKKLGKELDISEDLIKNEYQKQAMSTKRFQQKKEEAKEQTISKRTPQGDKLKRNLAVCEGELLNIVINHRGYFNQLRDYLVQSSFRNPLYQKVFTLICDLYDHSGNFDINMILDRLEPQEKAQIAMLKLKELKYELNDKSVRELLNRIELLRNQLNIAASETLDDLDEQIRRLREQTGR